MELWHRSVTSFAANICIAVNELVEQDEVKTDLSKYNCCKF